MSYSPRQAVDERKAESHLAVRMRDSEKLYQLAGLYKEEGEDEQAEALYKEAKKIDREDWSYDEARDNNR